MLVPDPVDNVRTVVAILTAIISGQDEEALQIIVESEPVQLLATLTGVLLSSLTEMSKIKDVPLDSYLQELGMIAARAG